MRAVHRIFHARVNVVGVRPVPVARMVTPMRAFTARYGQAYGAWQAAIARAQKQAKGADLPPKPDL